MDPFLMVIIIVVGVVVIAFGSFMTIMFFTFRARGQSLSYRKKTKTVPVGRYMKMFRFYSTFVVTKQWITTTHRDLSALSIYTYIEGRILTVKMFNQGLILYVLLIVGSLVLFQNPIFLLICLIFASIMRENAVHKKIEKLRSQLQHDMLQMLSSLRQEYMRTRSVVEAFESCNAGKYISRSVKEICDSLTATDSVERLEAFSAATPLPTLQTLATIAHIVNNRGDAQTPNGLSVFATSIDMVADEVRMALRREQTQKQLFGSLEFLPVVPIIGIVPLGMVFTNMIPGTAQIYEGALGFVFTLIILVASLVGYRMVVNACRTAATKNDDRSPMDKRLMADRRVRQFVFNLRPRKQKVITTKLKLLRASMTRNTIDYLYLRKTYMAIGGFIAVIVLCVVYVFVGRAAIWDNIGGSSMTGTTEMTQQEIDMLHTLDEGFLINFRSKPSDSEAEEFIRTNAPRMREYEIEDQVKRLQGKYSSYHGTVFYWWMILAALVGAKVAHGLPEYMLKRRVKLIESESEEDCLQLQTTIAIMMNTNTDTMELLEYLYKNSRVFRSVLIDAYQNYVSDPFLALRVAKSKTQLNEFRNMMDKLSLTVVQLTIAEAFSDLASERDHMLRTRESAQLHSLNTKRALIRPFAMAPLICLIALQFIAPICILAFSMFSEIMGSGLLEF